VAFDRAARAPERMRVGQDLAHVLLDLDRFERDHRHRASVATRRRRAPLDARPGQTKVSGAKFPATTPSGVRPSHFSTTVA